MSLELLIKIFNDYGPMFARGAWVTLYISITGTMVGSVIGLLTGIVRTIPMPDRGFKRVLLKVVNSFISIYIECFRGTPMIVQAMVIYYGVAQAFGIQMNRTFAALIIVSINTGAYMSEIVRGGILSIDKGQFEAAEAIGMNHIQTMINVVLPQVIRNILPATGNEFVINIKDTSVLNVISVTELFFQTKSISGATFKFFEPYLITSVIYLTMTIVITRILRYIERRMDGPANYIMAGNQMQVETALENIESSREKYRGKEAVSWKR
ncbi:amino acid ABC transporter permease [Alkaliphilus oremlandii]|uniref:Polar amino acid ABC transporter, inner membrane subunit n=1 Tax=Alkaliphilus oremlandii (strain OhILAs) TaxID=350688 RepID=A8MMB5_ALKOO|nr:amino acid ABC transporter permease [Alkaliphilus oremlandii]ABW18282.1 polar amino acid ABC transporter, inner membrane subunit [Alkaliphilus oremlandii OhILAs]